MNIFNLIIINYNQKIFSPCNNFLAVSSLTLGAFWSSNTLTELLLRRQDQFRNHCFRHC